MHAPDTQVLADIRSDVCDTVLAWTCVIGLTAVLLSLLRITQLGWLPIMGVHIAIITAILGVYGFRRQLPIVIRAGIIVGGMFMVGIGGHVTFGSPTRIEFFVSASIMATVFFGERAGIISTAASILVLAAIYLCFALGVLPDPVTVSPVALTVWITHGGALIVAALAPLVAVNRYRRHLEYERQRASEANLAKSEFLATMSHELRTPMTAILGISELLLLDNLPQAVKAKVARISKSGRILLELLNDLLDFSKIEANKLMIDRAPFRPRDLIEEICSLFTSLAADKKIALRAVYAPELSDTLIADSGRIRQVVLNLLGNAIKFTAQGSVTVRASQETTDDGGVMLKVEVADTGIGISEQQQAQIFQPFVQANRGVARRYGGTGLGLAISRRLADLMGGTITVVSRENQGATFTFAVPVAAGSDGGGSAARPSATPMPARNTRALRILVAEDNEAIGYLLGSMLRSWGNDVDIVGDGLAAVSAVQSADYDAVFMDMQMPGMDGPTATREIRKLKGRSGRVPIIAITADIVPEHHDTYVAAGVNALIGKPIDWVELAAVLNAQCVHVPAPPAATSEPPRAEAPVLDESMLSSLAGGVGRDAFRELMSTFAKNITTYHAEITAAVDAGDLRAARRTAHALKGLCLQFGAPRVARLAAHIDDETRGADGIRATLPILGEAIAALEQALSARAPSAS